MNSLICESNQSINQPKSQIQRTDLQLPEVGGRDQGVEEMGKGGQTVKREKNKIDEKLNKKPQNLKTNPKQLKQISPKFMHKVLN